MRSKRPYLTRTAKEYKDTTKTEKRCYDRKKRARKETAETCQARGKMHAAKMHKNRPVKLCIITKISKLIILCLKNKLTYYILLIVNSAAAVSGYSFPAPWFIGESS